MLSTFIDGSPEFVQALAKLQARGDSDLGRVEGVVREVLDAVRARGDEAVLAYVERFERRAPRSLVLRDFDGEGALGRLPAEARAALELAADRIRRFHEREREPGFSYSEDGVTLGLRVRPLARVGVYAPGGKARYPSSVLMSAVPAKVAGVTDVILATPLAGDASDDALLAAAYLSGITTILDAGGAQAIAAMAYGTASLPRVDKIVGPGNLYVACAKRMVYGAVAIDSIAGPSEILVVADETADARHVAADLLSQAEHDEDAYPLLLCTSADFARAVAAEVERQLSTLPKERTARTAVERQGAAFVVSGRDRLAEVADAVAAEHLSLQVAEPERLLERIGSAGAAFLGGLTPEAAGDYVAGPSHVLPTGGAVRFGSPLGVYDFVTRTSVLRYSAEALEGQGGAICALARLEGLEAHARAVEVRVRERE
ncbi:MAG: histidinol dehydrogenase [Myxococcales bacterium]|nr:histidinol dehydrogenase [Myxococcales bacterium]